MIKCYHHSTLCCCSLSVFLHDIRVIHIHIYIYTCFHASTWPCRRVIYTYIYIYIHIHLIAPTFSYDIYHKHPKVYIKLLAEIRWNCKFWFNFHLTLGFGFEESNQKTYPQSPKILQTRVLIYQPLDNSQALALSEGFRQRMLENNIQMYNSMLRPWECQSNGGKWGENDEGFDEQFGPCRRSKLVPKKALASPEPLGSYRQKNTQHRTRRVGLLEVECLARC